MAYIFFYHNFFTVIPDIYTRTVKIVENYNL